MELVVARTYSMFSPTPPVTLTSEFALPVAVNEICQGPLGAPGCTMDTDVIEPDVATQVGVAPALAASMNRPTAHPKIRFLDFMIEPLLEGCVYEGTDSSLAPHTRGRLSSQQERASSWRASSRGCATR